MEVIDDFMYTCIHRVYMWEAEPRLFWRVKLNGKWTWRKATLDEEGRVLPPDIATIVKVNENE